MDNFKGFKTSVEEITVDVLKIAKKQKKHQKPKDGSGL